MATITIKVNGVNKTYTTSRIILTNERTAQARIPRTILGSISPSEEELATKTIINTKNMIKKAYLESYITPVVAVAAAAPEIELTAGMSYFNTTTNTLYSTSTVTANQYGWRSARAYAGADIGQSGDLLVDITNDALYHWHDGSMHLVGKAVTATPPAEANVAGIVTLTQISNIASSIASSLISEHHAGDTTDMLKTYDILNDVN